MPARFEAKGMNGLRNWSLGFLGTAIAVTVCYLWLDPPLAHFAHGELQQFHLFQNVTLIPRAPTPLAADGLMGANFHLLSDAIAGSLLGISAGWLGGALWETGARQVRPDNGGASSGSTEAVKSVELGPR